MNEKIFLEALKGKSCFFFLVNGIKLNGTFMTDSKEALFMQRDGILSMTYKHATANVLPHQKLDVEIDVNYNK